MWNSIKHKLIIFIAVGASPSCWGQTYFTSNITAQDGLPSNRITCLAKSPKEFLWVGTDKGLVKLGQEITVCTTDHGLPSNKISALHVADNKDLWIGTSDNGISLFQNGIFENFSTNDGLASNQVTNLYYSSRQKLLFVGTNKGLSVLNGKKFSNFGNIGKDTWQVTGFLENDTSLWISTLGNGWLCYSFHRGSILPLPRKFRCYEDSTHSIHVTYTGDTLISCGTNRLKVLSSKSMANIQLNKRITAFASTPNGVCWALAHPSGKPSNIDLYLLKNDKLAPFGAHLSNVNNQINSLLVDETDGALIIGTKHRGMLIWPGFTFERLETNDECGTLHDICEDANGHIWILGNRLMKLSLPGLNTFSSKNLEDALEEKGPPIIGDSKFIASKGTKLYIGSKNKIWETKDGKLFATGSLSQLGDSIVSMFVLDSHIVANNRNRITLYNATSLRAVSSYPFFKEIHSVVEIGERIWILDKEKRLYCFDKKYFKPIETETVKSITSPTVNKITKDLQENLIVEDELGNICIYNFNTPAPIPKRSYISNSELVGNNLLWMLCDQQNNLWLGTDMGLSMIDLNAFYRTGKAHTSNWGKGEGYASNESFKAIQVKNGDIWVLSENKVMRFNPSEIKKIVRTPILKLSSISVMGNTNDTKTLNNSSTPKTFKHKHNSLVFSFDVANLLNKDRVLYQFRLVPGNTAWSAPSKQSFVYLSDLQPGKYSLTVKTWFQHAPHNPAIITYDFSIGQPWYFTVYAYVIYACAIILSLILLFDIKLKRIKKQEAYRRTTTEKVALLKMEALQAQMNPHFIFNALNTLQYNILEHNTDYSLEFLGEFSKLIRSTLDNASQHFISLKEELLYIENYMKVEQMRYSKQFYYSVSLADGLDPESTYVPPMIIQPHVENAIKYAFSTSIGYIIISFSKIHDKLICMVEDNGVGRKQTLLHKKTHRAKGQSITSQRFQLLNQFYQTNNEYRYEVEDLHDDNGNPSGTRVTLYFPLVGPDGSMLGPSTNK
ncbi:MAG: histidine kinase [Breznakibacter sp.]